MTQQARQAKYCPRCGAMTALGTEACPVCGHQFRTNAPAPSPADDELNKTRMFEMPPMVRRPDAPADAEFSDAEFSLDERAMRRARIRFLAVPILIVTLIVAVLAFFFWWLLR